MEIQWYSQSYEDFWKCPYSIFSNMIFSEHTEWFVVLNKYSCGILNMSDFPSLLGTTVQQHYFLGVLKKICLNNIHRGVRVYVYIYIYGHPGVYRIGFSYSSKHPFFSTDLHRVSTSGWHAYMYIYMWICWILVLFSQSEINLGNL